MFALAGFIIATILSSCSPESEQQASNTSTPASNAATNSTTGITTERKDGVQTFANDIRAFDGQLEENFVDFTFDYPDDWEYKLEANDPNARNFIKVERQLEDKSKGEFTLENFAVGSLKVKDAAARQPERLSQVLNDFSKQFAKWPNYKKDSEGPTKINNIAGYEMRFESRQPNTTRGPVTLWGRIVLLPHPTKDKGVALIMLASSLAPEIKSADDVGEKGQLPVILKTFKFL